MKWHQVILIDTLWPWKGQPVHVEALKKWGYQHFLMKIVNYQSVFPENSLILLINLGVPEIKCHHLFPFDSPNVLEAVWLDGQFSFSEVFSKWGYPEFCLNCQYFLFILVKKFIWGLTNAFEWGYHAFLLGIPGDTTFFWVGIPGDTWGYLGIPGGTYLVSPVSLPFMSFLDLQAEESLLDIIIMTPQLLYYWDHSHMMAEENIWSLEYLLF